MENKEIQIKKSTLQKIFIGTLVIFMIWFLLPLKPHKDHTTFSFTLENTSKKIDGKVYFDNVSMGETNNGTIKIYPLNETPKTIIFKGNYEGMSFEFAYEFPEDYMEYNEVPFSLTKQEIREYNDLLEYEEFMAKDMFSNVNKLHWRRMPLKYKFSDDHPCGITRKERILYGFLEIENSTNKTVSFVVADGNYDILIICNDSRGDTIYEDDYKYTTLAEGGIDYYWENIIINATLQFYSLSYTGGYYPATEIHEILHGFGYGHNEDPCSIMSPYIGESCKVKSIDEEIIKDLVETYSK